jgi:hypothetical protein
MKTLQEYILEAMNQEQFLNNVRSMFRINKKNNDFTSPYDVLKSANSKKGLLAGLESYINNHENKNPENKTSKIKNAGYYLAMLFDLSGLPVSSNKKIITAIINDNNVKGLYTMINTLLSDTKNGENKKQKNQEIFNNFKTSCLDDKKNNQYNLQKLGFLKNKELEDLLKYIYNIDFFKKLNNNSGNGKGELLLQLLFGVKNENGAGDVFLPGPSTLEVKGKNGKLGSSEINSTETTEHFINNLINKNNGYNIELYDNDKNSLDNDKNSLTADVIIKNNGSCFGGTKTNKDTGIEGKNGVTIFNEFWEKIKINVDKNTTEDDIFKCYIETILYKYYKPTNKPTNEDTNKIFNKLTDNNNPFKIEGNTLNIKENIDFTQLTGFLYLYAYQKSTGFNYLIVFDNNMNFKCLKCDKENGIIEKYVEVTKKFSFILPGNKDDKSNRGNVASINLKK